MEIDHSSMQAKSARSLPVLRAMIDAVDHEILQLLSRRNGLVAEIAQFKREHAVAIRDLRRERELLSDRRERSVPLGLSPDVIESIYRLVLWASRDRQAALRAEVPLDIQPRTVSIIGGKGAMGQCMASMFADLGHAVMVADVDTELSAREAASVADVVMISVPISRTCEVIRELGPVVRNESLLMDVTSIKSEPMQAMLSSTRASVLGTHPLFGPSVHSLQGQRIVFTPGRGDTWREWARQMFHARGLIVEETSPEEHDAAMSIVQVLTHFSTEVLGRTIQRLGVRIENTLRFTSPVYLIDMLMTARHFAQSPSLYASIQMSNPQTRKVTDAFVQSAREMATVSQAGDQEGFERLFTEIAEHFGPFSRQALEQSSFLIDRLVERL